MDLSIIIVSFNARADLARCLRALRETPPLRSHEVIVVDNASSDESAETARHAGATVIETGSNLGFARATNIGIRASRGTNLLLLNSDTIVPAGAIDRLLNVLDRHDDVAVVGPRLVDGDGRAELSFGRMVGPFNELRQKTATGVEEATRREGFPDWVSGACLLVRRRDAEAVGLLDERYFMYLEDVDFCAAIRALDRRVMFVPDVQIVHLRGRSAATATSITARAYRRSQLAFYAKHHPAWVPLLRLYLKIRGADT